MINHRSWRLYGDVAIKQTDITTFRKGESGIPIFVKGFFDVENQSFTEEKKIKLNIDSEILFATIYTVKTTGQTKMVWAIDLKHKLRKIFPNYDDGSDYPYLVFRRKDIDEYDIEVIFDISEYLIDIGANDNYVCCNSKTRNALTDEQLILKNRVESIIRENFRDGIKFSCSTNMILSNLLGENVPENIENEIKSNMYLRKDNAYFFFDEIAEEDTINGIKEEISFCIKEIGCFELQYIYEQFRQLINETIIFDEKDFEYYLTQIISLSFVSLYNARFGKMQHSMNEPLIDNIIKKTEEIVLNQYAGMAAIEDILLCFKGITDQTLIKIIDAKSQYLIKTIVNETICYQYNEGNVIPQNFSDILNESLEKIDELEIKPTEDVILAISSLKMDMNLCKEYCSCDSKIFRKMIENCYSGNVKRSWKKGSFVKED